MECTQQQPHCCRQIPLSSLWMTAALIWESPCWHDQEVLNHVGTSITHSKGIFLREFAAAQVQIFCIILRLLDQQCSLQGKALGEDWVKLLQRASQKGCDLLLQKSNLEHHIHSPLDTSHVFSGGVLYSKGQQRGTSQKISIYTFHLWDFHTWQLLLFLHKHLFSMQLQSPLNHNLEDSQAVEGNSLRACN